MHRPLSRFRSAGLVISLMTGLCVAVLPSQPVQAATCPSPGGADGPLGAGPGEPGAALVLAGGGWGHGVGMSQWAARGAAALGCDASTIVQSSYPGTAVSGGGDHDTVRVGLMTNIASQATAPITVTYEAQSDVAWQLQDCTNADACMTQPPVQPAGARWRVRAVRGDAAAEFEGNVKRDGQYVVEQWNGTDYAPLWRGGDLQARLVAKHDGVVVGITVGGATTYSMRWGETEFDSLVPEGLGHAQLYVVQRITPGDGESGLQRYLRGIAEVPSSWETAALRAQAITARTFALKRIQERPAGLESCRCQLRPTTLDQVYIGWSKESVDTDGRWTQAVKDTAAQVVTYNGSLVSTFYASTHGGRSSASKNVWGGDLPYLQSVDVSRWEAASGVPADRQRWTRSLDASEVADGVDLSAVESIVVMQADEASRPVPDINGDGKMDGARVIGIDDTGKIVERWFSGEQLRGRLSTLSARLEVAAQAGPTISLTDGCPAATPSAGFGDVDPTSLHGPSIDCVAWWGVAAGKAPGVYDPGAPVTRAQMATFVRNLLEVTGASLPASPPATFADVTEGVHAPAINQLAAIGLVSGTGTNANGQAVYNPGAPVTRAQMATFLVGAVRHRTGTALPADIDYFGDDNGNVHEAAINAARQAKLATGVTVDQDYSPSASVTRAQMASFLARTLSRLVTQKAAVPPS